LAKDKPSTNVTEAHKEVFSLLKDPAQNANFALMSCFVNGVPSCAIAYVAHLENGFTEIAPYFVAITPDMNVVDHHDDPPIER